MAVTSNATLAAHSNFEEPDVNVLYSMTSEQAGDSFGWVADPIGYVKGDGLTDYISLPAGAHCTSFSATEQARLSYRGRVISYPALLFPRPSIPFRFVLGGKRVKS